MRRLLQRYPEGLTIHGGQWASYVRFTVRGNVEDGPGRGEKQ